MAVIISLRSIRDDQTTTMPLSISILSIFAGLILIATLIGCGMCKGKKKKEEVKEKGEEDKKSIESMPKSESKSKSKSKGEDSQKTKEKEEKAQSEKEEKPESKKDKAPSVHEKDVKKEEAAPTNPSIAKEEVLKSKVASIRPAAVATPAEEQPQMGFELPVFSVLKDVSRCDTLKDMEGKHDFKATIMVPDPPEQSPNGGKGGTAGSVAPAFNIVRLNKKQLQAANDAQAVKTQRVTTRLKEAVKTQYADGKQEKAPSNANETQRVPKLGDQGATATKRLPKLDDQAAATATKRIPKLDRAATTKRLVKQTVRLEKTTAAALMFVG